MAIMVFAGIFVFGVFLIVISGKKINECKKYEFENRSDGGVVRFASYEESERFRKRQKGAQGQQSSGYVICIFAVFCIAFIINAR